MEQSESKLISNERSNDGGGLLSYPLSETIHISLSRKISNIYLLS